MNGFIIYTGKKLKPSQMGTVCVLPESHGNLTTWENIGITDKEVNSKRSNP